MTMTMHRTKKNIADRKGFTLAELFIVVAIIGVLVAISVPILPRQLKKARLAVNQANARNAYSAMAAEYVSGNDHIREIGLENSFGGSIRGAV